MAADGDAFTTNPNRGPSTDYRAASQGRRLAMWRPRNVGPNNVARGSLEIIRARARDAVRNDSWAGAANDKLVSNMIGTGIQSWSVNGTEQEQEGVQAVWDEWMHVCDADGVLDGYGLQAMVAREWDEAGEVFCRLRRRRPSDGLPVPLQLQLLESEQLPMLWKMADNGNEIRAGIEFSAIGKRVAYHFYRYHPQDPRVNFGNAAEITRVPAEDVLHIYEPLRIGQLRGTPRSTSVLVKQFNLDTLVDAAIERHKIGNLFGFFFRKKAEAGGTDSIIGANPEAQPAEGPLADFAMEPGMSAELPDGWDVQAPEPPAAGEGFFDIIKSQLLAICARHGIPYEVMTGDLNGVSDRALRLILNEFRRTLEQRIWLYMIPQYCQPVREAFFDAGVLAGTLDAPGYATRRSFYTATLHVPEGWPYSHPVQDIDADTKAVQAGFQAKSDVILSRGENPKRVRKQIAADNAADDAVDVAHTSDGRHAIKAGTPKAGATEPTDPAPRDAIP
jgi:lambda family phage portal protein